MTKARDLGDFISDGTIAETVTADGLNLGDNEKIQLGASQDLQLYHNGSASYITDQGSGNLVLGAADSIIFQNAAHNENMLVASQNGAVSLYHDNAVKFATSSTGATVTGTIAVSGDFNATSGTFTVQSNGTDILNVTSTLMSPQTDGAISLGSASNAFNDLHLDGSVYAELIRNNDDTDTYIQWPGSNTLAFNTGGSERMRIGSSGQIGLSGANYGTSGQVLTSSGSGGAPAWADAGGGGGSFDMTATGSITAGKVVALNSNGTVSTVVNQAGDPATPLSSGVNAAVKELNLFPSHAVDDARQRVVRVYLDNDNSNYGTAVCGQINSDGSISWGTPLVFYGGSLDCNLVVTYHVDSNLDYYVFYKRPGSNEPRIGRIRNTSGTTLNNISTIGNPGNYGVCSAEGFSSVYDPDSQRVVFAWYSTQDAKGCVAAVDGGSVTGSAQFTSNDWAQYADMTYDTTNNKCVHLRQYNNVSDARALVITVGASSVSVGSEVNTGAQGGSMPRCTFDPDSGKVILVGGYPSQATKTYYGMGTVSGTSSSWTNGVVNSTGMTDGQGEYDITYDTGADKLVMSYRKDGTNATYMRLGTVSGSSLTFGSEVQIQTQQPSFMRIDYLPTSGVSVMTCSGNSPTRVLASAVVTVVASTNPNWFGIADESISSGSAGKITHIGGINESVSGLTAGTTYYADKVGGLSATDTGYKVGKALSATKLLITEGNA